MALTRKFLAALGIEADKIDEIITAHTETTEGLKKERDTYKEQVAQIEALTKERDDLKTKVEGYEKDGSYKEKYDKLNSEYNDYKTKITAKETRKAKEDAYRTLLNEAGVSDKYVATVMKVSDIDSLELDENGKCKEAEKLSESIKTEWGDFISKQETKGAKTPTPPKNDGKGNTYKSKEEIMAIKDSVARQQAIAENPNLFGY